MLIITGFAVVGILAILGIESVVKGEYTKNREELLHKQIIVDEMEKNFLQMSFRIRGYFAFKNEQELQSAFKEGESLRKSIQELSETELSNDEEQLLEDLTAFVTRNFNILIPRAAELLETDDYAGLRDLSKSGPTDTVNNFMDHMGGLTTAYQSELIRQHDRYINLLYKIDILLVVYIFLLFGIIAFSMRKISRDIVFPLQELSTATNQITENGDSPIQIKKLDREDEIGVLSNAFVKMVKTVKEREEDLSAHNEELMAQQDTLTEQQERLEYSNRELQSLTKALNESAIVAITDKKGIITYANDKFCEISKYSKDELIGQNHRLLNSGHHSKEFFNILWKTINQGKIWQGEIKNVAKDGSNYWVDTTIVPYLDGNGVPYQFIAIRVDITGIKETEGELKRLLEETEKTKETLLQYNRLNHALSVTLDKDVLLNEILSELSRIFNFDKGVLFLNNDRGWASLGIAETQVKHFLETIQDSILVRLKETKKPHIIERTALSSEMIYHDESFKSYDLYAPIYTSEENLIAVLVCTRIGRGFSKEELHEISGILKRISLSIEKITFYEETENGRQLNQDIIDNVNEALQFVGTNGELIQYNEKMCEFIQCKYSKDYVLSPFEKWTSLFTQSVEEKESLINFMKESVFGTNEKETIQYEIIFPKRRVIDVYEESIYRNGQKIGTLFVHRDITAQHEVDQMKSELVSTVSHELRTPLASVLGFTELMLTRELKPERQKKYLETIQKEAERLTNLINDFLDLQRMESGRQVYEAENINIVNVIRDVMDTFKVHNKPTHRFKLKDHSNNQVVSADREKIVQLFTNLFGNAVKFSPNGGEISATFTNDEKNIFIHVADQGLGIPESELPKLFTKFHRIDNSDRKKIGGTGLGLSICKEIVDAHDGKITVRSELEKGSVFTIVLPLVAATVPEKGLNQIQSQNENLPTIIVLEDDKSLALLLQEELTGAGFNVKHFVKGEEALAEISKQAPEGVVVDLMLGEGMDGWTFIDTLKSDENTKSIPIFISSALDEKEKGMKFGIKHYLIKPYPPGKLSTVILQTLLTNQWEADILIPDDQEEEEE